MRVKRRFTAVCLLPFSCGRTGLSFCASVLLFLLDVEMGAGRRAGTGDRGSGKDIAGFLCSLKILTQWHWRTGAGVGRMYGFWDVGTGEHSSMRPSLDGDGSTCRGGGIPFNNGCSFSNSFSCMGHGGLSFEKLADSGSPRPFLWSSRPHSPPVGDSNRTIRRAEACQGWTSSPVPAAGRLRDLDVSTGVFAGLTTLTYANFSYVHCLSADPATAPVSTNTMTAGSCVLCSYLRPQDTLVPCGHAVAVLNKVNISPYRCIYSYLRPQDTLVPCGHAVAVLNKVNISPYRCISHVWSVSNWHSGNASVLRW